jgi:anti-anti-sigma factor
MDSQKSPSSHQDAATRLAQLEAELEERRRTEEQLRREIAEHKRVEQELLQKLEDRAHIEEELQANLELIRQQEEAIQAMGTPILRVWDGVLAVPVIGPLDAERGARMTESLLEAVVRTGASFVIVDLTGVEMMDAMSAASVLSIVRATGLVGARCLISGLSPAMARTIVESGLDLGSIATFGTLEAALRLAIAGRRQGWRPTQRRA